MPVASTRRWCLEPGLARSTGLGPVAVPPFSLVRGWSRRSRATTPAHRRRAAPPTGACAAAPTPPPAARRPCAGSRLSPSRSRARAVDVSTRSRCAARTRSPAAPLGPAPACGRIAEAPLPLRQQRLNPLPQPVGDDPRRNSHRHLPARRRIPTPFLIRERVPSCRSEFSGHGRLEVVEKGFDDEVVAGLDPVAPDRLVLTERLAVDRVSN
jgi:hypothetical protein